MRMFYNRILIVFLAVCMVLAGCAADVPAATTSTTGVTLESTAATTENVTTTVTTEGIDFETLDDEGPYFTTLSVGFGRVDISPTEPVPLRGYGYSSGRMSSYIQDPLYATCIALTDSGDNTVLLFTLDMTNSYGSVMDAARQQISQATGVPFDAIMVSATHNHSSPDLENTAEASTVRYITLLKNWMTQAAVAAMADRAPARVYITSTKTENLNFVRRYQLQNGTYAGDNFGNFKSAPISGHETKVDDQLQLVLFQRQNKKDVMLANFQTHPHREGGSSKTNVTSDLIGPFREKVESTLGCHVAYFTGASGNINPTSRIAEENITSNYIEHGHALADYALDAYSTFQEIPTTSVKVTKTIYTAKVDHTFSDWGPLASEAIDYYLANGDLGFYKQFLQGSGIKNVYHLNAVQLRSKLPHQLEIPIYAVSVGDLAFVTAPFEVFDTNGMQIKNGSPFSMTFVLTCANNNLSYLPSELAFKHGGYAVDVTLFARGTAEELVTSYLGMLQQLYFGS